MAMTNKMIIMMEQVELMKQGIIGTTGKQITVKMYDGNDMTFMEPEPIHTFQAWKDLGYCVKKGEHAIAKFAIWKYLKNKKKGDEEGEEGGHCYMKQAFFFKQSQVEKMNKEVAR